MSVFYGPQNAIHNYIISCAKDKKFYDCVFFKLEDVTSLATCSDWNRAHVVLKTLS